MVTRTAGPPQHITTPSGELREYEHAETHALVSLVEDAAQLIRGRGEAAFIDFREDGSRWRSGETYVFVLEPDGNMLVHPDPDLEGRRVVDLRDVNGKLIIRGLIDAATAVPDRPRGWYHYQWPVPGGILPRWKSSYVRFVIAPSGANYIVGAGMYNDRMERAFVVDAVTRAVAAIEKSGEDAFALLRDEKGPYVAKDAYVFVMDTKAVELVNPAFPSLEGQNLFDMKDADGRFLNHDIIALVETGGSGWIDYMWPKPGESLSTRKSAFVSIARHHGKEYVVGCGVYLEGAPKEVRSARKMTADELVALVRDAATLLEEKGEEAYPELRSKGSKWFRDDTYVFISTMDGVRAFNAAEPELEGCDLSNQTDSLGRPIVRMIVEAGSGRTGEGWVHYIYPVPGSFFPAWKSSFVKRVTYPSGTPYVVGSGIYNMEMERRFIEDIVDRAAALIEEQGEASFIRLRDRRGPFVFMDTYVFVLSPDGVQRVNPIFPSLEGENLVQLRDVQGRALVREEIEAAMEKGSAWVEGHWYTPGSNTPARKATFVRKVEFEGETFIVGAGIYPPE